MFAFRKLFKTSQLFRPVSLVIGLALGMQYTSRKSECCGIIGVVSTANNAEVVVAEGIKLLQNRGYDSAGIVTFHRETPDKIEANLTKYAIEQEKNCIQKVVNQAIENHKGSFVGIGHTRWATCGNKSSHNAHPHFDESHNYYLVHNGTIVNYKELRNTHLKNTVFTSQTDTEVIVQLLAKECEENHLTVEEGLRKIEDYLIGQWGLVVINKKKPSEICVATYGSPILIGFGVDSIYVASETIAFEKYTKDYVEMKNEEVFTLSLETVQQLKKTMTQKGRMLKITQSVKVKLHPDPPFTSFYEEEIHEQGELKFKPYLATLEGVTFGDSLTLLGCGTSHHAGIYAQYFFKILQSFKRVVAIDAAEAIQQDFQEGETILLVSQSGQTKDLLNSLETAKKVPNVKSVAVVNVYASALARKVDCVVFTNVGRQVAVGATKSFTHQILNLVDIALKVAQLKGLSSSQRYQDVFADLDHIHLKIKQTIQMALPKCKEIAKYVMKKESMYILAKGEALAIAKQGALKIKELCYIHAEAFGASQMKHGPLALVDYQNPKTTVVFFLVLNDKNLAAIKVAIDELHSRKAFIVVITNCGEELNRQKIDELVEVPKLKLLSSLLCLYPLQIIANEICLCLGIDPDKPRNLAKTVTV